MNLSDLKIQLSFVARIILLLLVSIPLAACNGGIDSVFPKAERPVPPRLVQKMKALGMPANAPIVIRIFKSEDILEVWKQKDTGRYAKLESYEICKWSGKLGPKFKEGDRQAPEGFYSVGKAQMNPNSDYHLSFNIGFPNRYDRAHGRTGTHLMVHGACSSAGCYSMTDGQVEEIYSLARDAIKGGQDYFQVQAFPFRMTAENLAKHAANKHFEFWKMLKEGSDHFELTNYPPKVDVCEKRYLFNRKAVDGKSFSASAACPAVTMPGSLLASYSKKLETEKAAFKKALRHEQAKAKRKGTALANVDVANLSIVAKGSEVLPPATPKVAPSTPITEEPAIASTAPGDKETIAAVEPTVSSEVGNAPSTSSIVETPNVAAIPTPSPVQSSPQAPAADETVPSQTVVAGEGEVTSPSVIPVPQPAQRNVVVEAQPAKKKPWWKRN